jgi:hypothetical protein
MWRFKKNVSYICVIILNKEPIWDVTLMSIFIIHPFNVGNPSFQYEINFLELCYLVDCHANVIQLKWRGSENQPLIFFLLLFFNFTSADPKWLIFNATLLDNDPLQFKWTWEYPVSVMWRANAKLSIHIFVNNFVIHITVTGYFFVHLNWKRSKSHIIKLYSI